MTFLVWNRPLSDGDHFVSFCLCRASLVLSTRLAVHKQSFFKSPETKWRRVTKVYRVRIWRTGRHSPTKNSQEYPSGNLCILSTKKKCELEKQQAYKSEWGVRDWPLKSSWCPESGPSFLVWNRPLSHGGHFVSFCLRRASLVLSTRLAVQVFALISLKFFFKFLP